MGVTLGQGLLGGSDYLRCERVIFYPVVIGAAGTGRGVTGYEYTG